MSVCGFNFDLSVSKNWYVYSCRVFIQENIAYKYFQLTSELIPGGGGGGGGGCTRVFRGAHTFVIKV